MRKYFPKIQVNKQHSLFLFKTFAKEWNAAQCDENGKWLKGGKRLREVHYELYSGLIALLIEGTIARQNKLNDIDSKHVYNIEKPLLLKASPYRIRNIMAQGCSLSLQTVKNRMERLQECGLISRKWSRDDLNFEIELYPRHLVLTDPESQQIIKTNDFENICKPNAYKTKNENLQDTSNTTSNNKNKKIHFPNVNKSDSLSRINPSQNNEHLKKRGKKCNTKDLSNSDFQNQEQKNQQTPINNESERIEQVVAGERLKHMELQSKKKDAANRIYTKLIAFFWEIWTNLYLPETAPSETLHYVHQSINTLVNDPVYFGSCNNDNQINYQENKLNQALLSTKNWVTARKKKNPEFNFSYLYPNAFLANKPGPGMSFKNSVINTEIKMARQNKLQMEIEKAIQRDREKQSKEKHNYTIENIIAYIYQHPKENTRELVMQAGEYLWNLMPDLIMKLQTDISNPNRVKQIIQNVKQIDEKIIADCFLSQQKIKQEIDSLLPVVQKLLQKNKLTMNQTMFTKFDIGHEYKVTPKAYNINTLKYLQFYTKK